ncbi:50S ribosomal protein L29 [Candidatus Peregrinibacteria bacterium]|jgi:large subunit ribosomal protein L29|nr:50S ribosomal protein L29 [Candidatus Peregrinibacteria bacterium]MBT6401820.1 50S ribosomal protein L29 [candidate division WWE3 bacterium]MBT7736191.1 50S ribosomal protein L29 [Candidatus Peregrinibacteria bacterium]
MKTVEELRKLEEAKLLEELAEAKKSLFKIKFESESGQAKNTHDVAKSRKHVAQIKTILKEKDLTQKEDDKN